MPKVGGGRPPNARGPVGGSRSILGPVGGARIVGGTPPLGPVGALDDELVGRVGSGERRRGGGGGERVPRRVYGLFEDARDPPLSRRGDGVRVRFRPHPPRRLSRSSSYPLNLSGGRSVNRRGDRLRRRGEGDLRRGGGERERRRASGEVI